MIASKIFLILILSLITAEEAAAAEITSPVAAQYEPSNKSFKDEIETILSECEVFVYF